MRIFITGITGQLGLTLKSYLIEKGHIVFGCGRKTLSDNNYISIDITNKESINQIKEYKPDVIIHTAAYTLVDKAEFDRTNCYNINVIGTKNIVDIAKELNCKLIYISSDYVYGSNNTELLTEESATNPLNIYGMTKRMGETYVNTYEKSYIARVSWLYSQYGNNFVKTMLRLSETRSELTVINDQIGRPTNCKDLSKVLLEFCETENYGIYNISNTGEFISWYDFACAILSQKNIKINPIDSLNYFKMDQCIRQKNSRLDLTKLEKNNYSLLPDWKISLMNFLKEYTN